MKIISLNTWGCRIEKIFEYIKENEKDTDIFCFQEILKGGNGMTSREEIKGGFEKISEILFQHNGYFCEYEHNGAYYGENREKLDFEYGIACFVKKDLPNKEIKKGSLISGEDEYGNSSYRFAVGETSLTEVSDYAIINVHGMWQNSIKTDTDAKIQQSKKILDLTEKSTKKKIICGDFNLLPDTNSIKMIEVNFRNLIKEFGIKSTRSNLYTKETRYSDYLFVDKKIKVENFSVVDIEVSDHLPLLLEFS